MSTGQRSPTRRSVTISGIGGHVHRNAHLEGAELAGQDPRAVESTTLTLLKIGAEAPAAYKEYVIEDEASVVVERAETTIEVLMILEDGRWKIADERFIRMPILQ